MARTPFNADQTWYAHQAFCLFEVAQLEERARIALSVPFERWCDLIEQTEVLQVASPSNARTYRKHARCPCCATRSIDLSPGLPSRSACR